jgi:hypothetical protein
MQKPLEKKPKLADFDPERHRRSSESWEKSPAPRSHFERREKNRQSARLHWGKTAKNATTEPGPHLRTLPKFTLSF